MKRSPSTGSRTSNVTVPTAGPLRTSRVPGASLRQRSARSARSAAGVAAGSSQRRSLEIAMTKVEHHYMNAARNFGNIQVSLRQTLTPHGKRSIAAAGPNKRVRRLALRAPAPGGSQNRESTNLSRPG
jgi:hypothetical protein